MTDEIISIFTTYDATEADMIKAQLESEGIECFLKGDNAGGTLGYLTATTGIDIMIRQDDEKKAAEVLRKRK